jgi:hypothetical protein
MMNVIFRTWVSNSADPTKALQAIVDSGMAQLLQTDKHGASDTYPTLTRSAISVHVTLKL